jgi:hypothetical protein
MLWLSIVLRGDVIRGVDFVQEKFLGQGPQDNENAIEQAKDEQISDFIRDKYKGTTGKVSFRPLCQ